MEHFLATILLELTPQNIFGLFGGLLGGIAASDKTKYGKQLTIIAIIMSAVAGGAVSDYLVESFDYKNIFAIMIFCYKKARFPGLFGVHWYSRIVRNSTAPKA